MPGAVKFFPTQQAHDPCAKYGEVRHMVYVQYVKWYGNELEACYAEEKARLDAADRTFVHRVERRDSMQPHTFFDDARIGAIPPVHRIYMHLVAEPHQAFTDFIQALFFAAFVIGINTV